MNCKCGYCLTNPRIEFLEEDKTKRFDTVVTTLQQAVAIQLRANKEKKERGL